MTSPAEIESLIDRFGLEPHPEGGHYRRTFTHPDRSGGSDGRAAASAILYLLLAGERSAWHRIGPAELWLFHAGDPLELLISTDGTSIEPVLLGGDVADGRQVPQAAVPPGAWQSARSHGTHSLVSCVVVPEFRFDDFELAPRGWRPGG